MNNTKNKLKSLKELKNITQKLQKRGKRIVLANGCFDLLHIGHLRYLEAAKRRGDLLIVALNNDDSVKAIKGTGRPLMKMKDRVALISALGCVDYVTAFGEPTVKRVLLSLKPDVHAKGGDYKRDNVPEKDIVRSYGGRIAIVGGRKIQSTSDLIKDIRK